MAKSNWQVNLIKAVPFACITLIFYLHDFSQWYSALFSQPWLSIPIFAITISIFGAIAKGKLISAYSDLAVGSWILGTIFILAGLGLYIYGTVSTTPYFAWAQFESALFFILSFISLSYDWRLVRTTGFLFLITALAYPVPYISNIIGMEKLFYATAVAMLIIFLVFAASDLKLIVGPFLASAFVFGYALLPSTAGNVLPFVLPLCFIVYALPALRRRRTKERENHIVYQDHVAEAGGLGFCSLCGKKYEPSAHLPKLGLAGLVVIFLVLALLSFPLVEIPVLQLHGGSVPQYNVYKHDGVSVADLPLTPQGWLTNSSSALSLSGDLYALKNVYVPATNPNTSNYTLYFELSQGFQSNMSSAWGNKLGWNRAQTHLDLGGLGGFLIIYTPQNASAGNPILIVYSGSERLTFLQPFGEKTVTMQLSFTRNFSSTVDVQAAANSVVSDIKSNWQGWLLELNPASSWSGFLFSMYSIFLSIFTILAIIVSSSLIVYLSYRAIQGDSKTDHFLEIASELDENEWNALSTLIASSSSLPKTELELSELIDKRLYARPNGAAIKLVRDLEKSGLLTKVTYEARNEVLQGWRMSIKFGFI